MKFWLEDTKELTNNFTLIPNSNMNDMEYYNTITRIIILVSVIIFIIFRNKFILILGVVFIFISIIKYKNKDLTEEYTNKPVNVLIEYPKNNLYNSDLIYDTSNNKCDYKISDRNNEINNPINININYYKYYNNRNNICQKNGIKNYDKFLEYLYPHKKLKYCKEGFNKNCFIVQQNYTPNYAKYQLN